jgi:serine/threonine protein kinase
VQSFTDFTIERLLGEGGMCQVYRAHQASLDRHVALKLLRSELIDIETEVQRFIREGKTCATLRHPNILQVYEVGVEQDQPFIAMEYIKGSTLATLLKRGLPLSEGLELMAQISSALEHAHEQGVVHRDLKPANVLVTSEGQAKVVDWGLARHLQDDSGLTKTGILIGTPAYMAPEQITEGKAQRASDLYALGTMIFELVAGFRPFTSSDMRDLLSSRLSKDAPNLRSVVARCPISLSALVRKLLQRKPKDREISAKQVAIELRQIGRDLSQSSAAVPLRRTKPATAPQVKEKRKPNVAFIPLALLVLTTLGFLFLYKSGESSQAVPKITGLRLAKLDELVILLSHRATTPVTVSFHLLQKGKKVSVPYHLSHIDLQAGKAIPGGTIVYKSKISPSLSYAVQATVSVGDELFERSLSPEPFLRQALDPAFALGGKVYIANLRKINRLRNELSKWRNDQTVYLQKIAEAKIKFHGLLAEMGLTTTACRQMKPYLKRLLLPAGNPKRRTAFLSSPLVNKLRNLRYIEVAISEIGGLTPPWGSVNDMLGITYERLGQEVFLTDWTEAGKKELLIRKGSGYCWLWLEPEGKISTYHKIEDPIKLERTVQLNRAALERMISQWEKSDGPGETIPQLKDLKYTTEFTIEVKKRQGPWPPKEARLMLESRFMSHDFDLRCHLNDGTEMMFVDTSLMVHKDNPQFVKKLSNLVSTFPIDPQNLRLGPNRVRLTLKCSPIVASTSNPLGLRMAKIYIR